MMKCVPKPGLFRRSRLGLPSPREYPPQTPLTPQHPKAKLKLVNEIIRRSLSSKSGLKNRWSSVDGATDDVAKECTVADSFSDISKENEWFLLNVQDSLPRARSKHAAVASEGNMYVVGGDSVDGQLCDVQVFNMDAFSWTQLCSAGLNKERIRPREPVASYQSGPLMPAGGPRLLAPFVSIWNGKLIVVGCAVSVSNDSPVSVYSFDPSSNTWTVLNLEGEVPDARVGYRMVQVRSKLVMFAGEDASGRIVADVYILDLEKLAWQSIETGGVKPAPRKYHAMACYAGRYIWIYGGKSYATYYNDIYCLDLDSLMWTNVKVEGPIPTIPRSGHVGVMQGEKFYIIGGENRGDEMVDTLAFDIEKRAWSVVTSVNAMSPLAHNGLSVIKVKHQGKRYLLAFGGHGILLSCQMYALLLPETDEGFGRNSLSSFESLSLKSGLKNSTPSQDKTSPKDPFHFHRSVSLSSSSSVSDSAVAAAEIRREPPHEESPISSQKEWRKVKTRESSPDFDSWEETPLRDIAFPNSVRTRSLSEELHKLGCHRNIRQHDLSPLIQDETGDCEEGFIQNNNQSGRLDSKGSRKNLQTLFETRDESLPGASQDRDEKATGPKSDPHTSEKKNRSNTNAINEKLRLVAKTIKELHEAHKSSMPKDDELSLALQTIHELQEEIQELRKNRRSKERKMPKTSNSVEPMTDKQSGRGNPAEIEPRTQVARGPAPILTKNKRGSFEIEKMKKDAQKTLQNTN